MTEREKFILLMALIYAHANLDDINVAFEDGDGKVVVHNHDTGIHATADEVAPSEFADLCLKLTGRKLL